MLFRTIFEQAPIGIAILRNYNFLSNINTMLEKILGRSKNELSLLSWVDITYPDDLKEELEKFKKLKSGEIDRYSMEKRFIKPDGSNTWVNVVITKLELKDKDNQNYLCIVQDINKRKHALETLKESERSKSVFLSHLPGLAYRCKYDKDRTVLFISDGCFKLTKYKPKDFINNKDLLNTQIISPEYREIIWKEWQRVISLKKPFQYEYEIITALGERKWVWEIGQGIYDEKGNVEALEGIVIDITESKKRLFQIQFMSDHDFMTGLYNRKYFEESKKKMDKEDCLPLSIIIADINGLRLINDAFGYSEGDWVITKTGKIIQSCCRKEDILARIGGDEFNILLSNTNGKKAYEILHKIKNACEQYNLSIKNKAQSINLSIGYGTKQTKEESIQTAEKEAEEYMNKRKLLESKSYHHMILASIMATMYVRSHETENHAKRLARMSKLIGEKMKLSQRNLDDLQLLAMLHDIGKVGIDDKILNKPGKLTDEEWVIMKNHSEFGYRIAMSSPELAHIAKYILSHHERWNGTGYPSGLIKEEIPLLSRILAIVDAYDAMTKKRVYRKTLTKKAAIEEITKNAGTQFDPEIVKVFIEIMK